MNEVIQHGAVGNLMMDADAMMRIDAVAKIMAQSEVTIPKHLKNYGDSFAVAMQAAQWGMNPFAVAQKTHLVNGILGYEAQLVNAIIVSRAPVTGRLKIEFAGDWSRVNGKEDKDPSRICTVSATFIGEDEPRTYSVSMAQVGHVRNSPLWVADPRLQLAYLTIKRWSRLYCPDVIMGVYSQDELQDGLPPEVTIAGSDVNAEPTKAQTAKDILKDRSTRTTSRSTATPKTVETEPQTLEGTAEEVAPTTTVINEATLNEVVAESTTTAEVVAQVKPAFDVEAMITKINAAKTIDELKLCSDDLKDAEAKKLVQDADKLTIRKAYLAKKEQLPPPEPEFMPEESIDAICQEMNKAETQDALDNIFNTRVRDFSTKISKKDHLRLDKVHSMNTDRITPPEDDMFGQ